MPEAKERTGARGYRKRKKASEIMTISEKIQRKKAQIEISKQRICLEKKRIENLTTEIKDLESMEMQDILNELKMPWTEVAELLRGLKELPPVSTDNADSTDAP